MKKKSNNHIELPNLSPEIPEEYRMGIVYFAARLKERLQHTIGEDVNLLKLYQAFEGLPPYYKNLLQMYLFKNRGEAKKEMNKNTKLPYPDISEACIAVCNYYTYLVNNDVGEIYTKQIKHLWEKAEKKTSNESSVGDIQEQ